MAGEEGKKKTLEKDADASVTDLLAQQVSMMSQLLDTFKKSTTVSETHVGQDVGADEAIAHQTAMIPLNAKFWFDQVAMQAVAANGQMVKHLANLDEIAASKARHLEEAMQTRVRDHQEISKRISRTWSSEDKLAIDHIWNVEAEEAMGIQAILESISTRPAVAAELVAALGQAIAQIQSAGTVEESEAGS